MSTCRNPIRPPVRRSRRRMTSRSTPSTARTHALACRRKSAAAAGSASAGRETSTDDGAGRRRSAPALAAASVRTSMRVAGGWCSVARPPASPSSAALRLHGATAGSSSGCSSHLAMAERAARARSGSPMAGRSGSGGCALDGDQPRVPRPTAVDARHGVDQRPSVGMARIGAGSARSGLPPPPRRRTSRGRASRCWR